MSIEQSIDSNVASFPFPHNPLISVLNQKQFTSIIFIPASQCNLGRLMHETYWLVLKANIIYQNGLAYFGKKMFIKQSIDSNVAPFAFPHDPLISVLNPKCICFRNFNSNVAM